MEQVITSVKQMPFKLDYHYTPFEGVCINFKCGKMTDRVYQFHTRISGVKVEAIRACCRECALEYYKFVVHIK